MPTSTTHAHRRPRPGPLRLLLVAGLVAVITAVAFVTLLVLEAERAAAALLLLVPAADAAMRIPGRARYFVRHIGLAATSHLLVAVWAAGVIAVLAGGIGSTASLRIAALVAAGATVLAGVERVVWARFPNELASHRLVAGSRTPRLGLMAVLTLATLGGQLAATGLIIGSARPSLVEASLVATAMAYGIRAAAVMLLATRRVLTGDAALRPVIGAGVLSYAPETLVHFSGSIQTLYQLDQWMPLVLASGQRCLLVVRELPVFHEASGRWDVPVVFVGEFPDLDLVVVPSVRLALYVNTGTKNNQLVRFDDLTHVQLHHGDSDKPTSSSKTMRLYDHHVVAGPAAVERLRRGGAAGPDSISMVGRPQALAIEPGPLGHQRPVVVYAPTWEGFHVDTPLSSLSAMGLALVERIPSGIDVVFRPHPLTGTVDRRLRSEVAAIRGAALRRDGGRFVEPNSVPVAATLAEADVLITDVSSVLVDFLTADRPALVTNVTGLIEPEFCERYPSTAWAGILTPDLERLAELLTDALGPDTRAPRRRESRAHLLGGFADPVARFHEVLSSLGRDLPKR